MELEFTGHNIRGARSRGFALIIALSLMSLIVLMMVAMSSLAQVEIQQADVMKHRDQARLNAKLALSKAIGVLQKELGPDLRVSARGEILNGTGDSSVRANKNRKLWTGVWDASGYHPENPSKRTFRKWLVSRKDENDRRGGHTSISDVSRARFDNPSVNLFLVDESREKEFGGLSVEKVDILSSDNSLTGKYAWGVIDDGVKAKVSIPNRMDAYYKKFKENAAAAFYQSLINGLSHRNAIELLQPLSNKYKANRSKLEYLMTMDQLNLLNDKDGAVKQYFSDLTPNGYSLLTNMRRGGLKQDLSRGLGNQYEQFIKERQRLFPFSQSNSFNSAPKNLQSVSWGMMKSYADLYKKLDMSSVYNPSIRPRETCQDDKGNWQRFLPDKVFEHTSVLDGSLKDHEGNRLDPEIHPVGPVVTQILYRIKILGRFKSKFTKAKNDGLDNYEWLVSPQFVLWNPYNVKLSSNNYRVHFDPSFQFEIYYDKNGDGSYEVLDWKSPNENKDVTSANTTPSGSSKAEWYDHLLALDYMKAWDSHMHLIMNAEFEPGEVKAFGLLDADHWKTQPHPNYTAYQYGFDDSGIKKFLMLFAEDYESPKGIGIDSKTESFGVAGLRFMENSTIRRDGLTKIDRIDLTSSNASYKLQGRFYLSVAPEEPDALSFYSGSGEPAANFGTVIRVGSAFRYNEGDRSFTLNPFESAYQWRTDGQSFYPVNIFYNLRSTHGTDSDKPVMAQFNPLANHFTPSVASEGHSPLWRSAYMTRTEWNSFSGLPQPSSLSGYANWGSELGEYGQKNVIFKEIHRQPLVSVGQLMHADLGIVDTAPLYTVGNSYVPPFSTDMKDRVYTAGESDVFGNTVNTADWAWFYNDALFDDYFFSTIPEANMRAYPPFKDFDEDFVTEGGVLPNSRHVLRVNNENPEDEKMRELQEYDQAAANILVDGGFNVNSTSKVAWKLFLGSLNRNLSSTGTGSYYDAESKSTESREEEWKYNLSRFSNPMGGGNSVDTDFDAMKSWTGFRTLTSEELDKLAEAMVAEVKKRGPFLNMSDFVNRRLENTELGKKGALQAALDSAINLAGQRFDKKPEASTLWGTSENTRLLAEDNSAGQPGWILQNDVLKSLAPSMNTRSDTFTIRCYGESLNEATGLAISRAVCEAVVQRFPDYVDDRNEAYAEASIDVNKQLGRAFKIVGFRWLNTEEVKSE